MPYNNRSDLVVSVSEIRKRVERVERNSGKSTFTVPVTVNYTASQNDLVLADATGGTITVTLPTPSLGMTVVVKRLNAGANTVIIVPSAGGLIDNGATLTISIQYNSYTMVSDGTNWWII